MLQMRDDTSRAGKEADFRAAPAKSGANGPSSALEDGLAMPRRLWAIVAISFGTALFVLDGTIANVALPSIARDLGVGEGVVVNVVTVYQLVMVMALLPFANLGEQWGLRRVYQWGQVIFMVASALAFLVNSLPALLVVRALQALGAGMAMSVSTAMIRQIYPTRRLGSGLGINSVIVASSNALAPVLGGFIVARADWHWIFVAAAPFALASLMIGRFLPDPVRSEQAFDWRSGLWSAASFAMLVGGMELASHGSAVAVGLAVTLAGLASSVLLARRERTHHAPVFPVDLLSTPSIGFSALAAIAGFLASAALIVALPFRLELAMGYTPEEVGLLVLPFPLTMLFVAPAAGWLSDRYSPSLLGLGGMVIAIAGLVAVAWMPANAGTLAIAWRLALCALGFGLFFSPNARLVVGTAPRDRAAAAGGLLATARLFGQTLGAAVVGVLLSLGTGQGPVPMLFAIALALVAAGFSLARWSLTERPRVSRAG